MTNKEMFYISGAWNTGIGFVVHGYDFIITTVQTVGFSKNVVVRNSEHERHLAKVVFVDYSIGLAFIEKKIKQEASLDILSFELAVLSQPVCLYKIDYYNEMIKVNVDLIDKNFVLNNIKYLQIKNPIKISIGEIVLNKRLEFVGITTIKENKNLVLPAKYILKTLEEYKNVEAEALRCPNCLNIIEKNDIIDRTCPVCSSEIIKELLEDVLPSMTEIDKNIEDVIEKLGFDNRLVRLGQHFWEIKKGSATIFIRYEKDKKYIVAFSSLCELSENHNSEIYKYLLSQNSKLKFLSFSIEKKHIFLSAPYIFDSNFDEVFAKELFRELFEKSDFYDDILIKMLNS